MRERFILRANQLEKREGDGMFKGLGLLIGGIFVGAVGMEIYRRECPDALKNLYKKAGDVAVEAKEAFKKGYDDAVSPKKAAKASA